MRASLIEVDRIDWTAFRCGCGDSGGHVGEDFRRLLRATSPEEVIDCTLSGHVEDQAMLFEVALPAVGVILAGLHEDIAAFVRGHFLVTLWRVVAGEPHPTEIQNGRELLDQECLEVAASGLWDIYNEAMSGDAETAVDILEFIERDESRLSFFKGALMKAGKI